MVHPSILLGLLAITGGILSLAPPGVTVLALDLRSRDDHAAENHGFAAENSCCPMRNPAARGWENKCSTSG